MSPGIFCSGITWSGISGVRTVSGSDIGNANDRLTGNVFADIPGDVNPHAIHIEGSNVLNEIDNNIFDHLTGGILIRDSNNVIIAYNLFSIAPRYASIQSPGSMGPDRLAVIPMTYTI